MRRSDALAIEAGTSGRELMMRAARGIYESGRWEEPVAVMCGAGNNAGDGYALALLLNEAGMECTVFLAYEDKFSADGRYYHDECVRAGIPVRLWDGPAGASQLAHYLSIADCLLGTGFKGAVREPLAGMIDSINSTGAYIVSADINSGLNGDSGMAKKCVISKLTVSVGGFKPGHFLNMAKDVMEEKVNIDIGIKPVKEPYGLIEKSDVKEFFGVRKNHSNKGTYGYVALIGGSTRYSGAIRLAAYANAAMRCGAGVAKIAMPSSVAGQVMPHILESTLFPLSEEVSVNGNAEIRFDAAEARELLKNVRCAAFGMGIGTGEGAAAMLEYLLSEYEMTLIVDADGLTLLSSMDKDKIRSSRCSLVLTPHVLEFSRLTGLEKDRITEDPIGTAAGYAEDTGAVVLLKGSSTVVTDGKMVYITDRGCPGMATAGSGDVLSGILAATASQRFERDGHQERSLCLAAAVAAYINGAAGEAAQDLYGSVSMTSGDTAAAIASVLKGI